jgi:(p)ppGpp synthase/HD superfamily hydrolase
MSGNAQRRQDDLASAARLRNGKWSIISMTEKWIIVLKAADAAARWHVHQQRKGAAAEPYINHLLEVATFVAEATNATEPDLVIAALLHDAIEDQQVPREIIANAFGEAVANVIEEVTDDKSLPKEERKRLQIATASRKSRGAKILKLADMTSNLKAIAASPPRDWSVQRRLEYVKWARAVAVGLIDASPMLEERLDHAAAEAQRVANQERE